MDSDGLKKRITDWKMKTKMAQFLTYSWRQKQRGQEDWFTPYATSPEFLKISMGIVFYSLYQATVTM